MPRLSEASRLWILAALLCGACGNSGGIVPAGSGIGLPARFASPGQILGRFLPADLPEAAAILLADLDGDGRQDLVFDDRILWNEPDRGHFRGASTETDLVRTSGTGVRTGVPLDAVAGDLDGDGAADLLFARREGVALFRNAGGRRFVDVTSTALPPDPGDLWRARLADLEGDGDLDALLLGVDDPWLLVNTGAGIFTDRTARLLPADAPGGSDAAFGDIDGDGDPDLLIASRSTGAHPGLWILVNDGSGRFTERASSAMPPFQDVQEVELADLDGDGDTDLATVNSVGLHVFTNDGSGSFLGPVGLRSRVSHLFVADEDGDDLPDLATYDHPDVLRFRNLGQMAFREESVLGELHGRPGAWADVDGNGRPDFVTSRGRLLFCQQDFELWTWAVEDGFVFAPGIEDLRFADLDGDLDPDAAVVVVPVGCLPQVGCFPGRPVLSIHFNDGRAQFIDGGGTYMDPSLSDPRIHVGDLDGDGWKDVVGDRGYLRNEGGGRFATWYPVEGPLDGALGDLDGDGDLDVLRAEPALRLLRNDGGSPQVVLTDVTSSRLIDGGAALQVLLADLDGDSALDAVFRRLDGTIGIHRNDGAGTLRPSTRAPPPLRAAVVDLAAADLDRDGGVDLIVAEHLQGGSPVQVWWNDGNGGFQSEPPTVPLLAAAGDLVPEGVACADLDADGLLDLYVRGETDSRGVPLFVLRNQGGRAFADATGSSGVWRLPDNLWPIVRVGDLDGDGDADLTSGRSVLLNTERDLRARNRAFGGRVFRLEVHQAPGRATQDRLAIPLLATNAGAAAFGGLGVLRLETPTLAILPAVTIPAPAGTAQVAIRIPAQPVLVGIDLHAQVLYLDAAGMPARLGAPFVERVGY